MMNAKYQVYIGIEGQDESKINTSEDDCWNEEDWSLETFDKLEDAQAFVGSCQQIDKLEAELTSAQDDVADFNRGWKWAQDGKELDKQEDNCLFIQGWEVFMFDEIKAQLAEAKKEIKIRCQLAEERIAEVEKLEKCLSDIHVGLIALCFAKRQGGEVKLETIEVAQWHYKDIFKALDWMITALDFNKQNIGMDTDDSPEMKKAKRVRDIVGLKPPPDLPKPQEEFDPEKYNITNEHYTPGNNVWEATDGANQTK